MVHEVNTVQVVVQWKEGNKVEKRTLNVAEGTVIDAEKSGKFTATKSKGNAVPIWNMDKGDAYVLLGASHAKPDKKGEYKFDRSDMNVLRTEWNNSFSDTENGQLQQHTAVRSGTGAGHISSAFFNTNGEYVVNHGSRNNRISIFMK